MFSNVFQVLRNSCFVFFTHYFGDASYRISSVRLFLRVTTQETSHHSRDKSPLKRQVTTQETSRVETLTKWSLIHLNERHKRLVISSVNFFSTVTQLRCVAKYFTKSFTIVRTVFNRSLHKWRLCTAQGVWKFFPSISRSQRLIFISNGENVVKKYRADYANMPRSFLPS